MKEKARDLMVRNKFIAAQQSCDLRQHLDSAAPETSIGDIVDSCRIWESHAEPVAIDNWCQDPVYSQPTLLMPPPATGISARLRYKVGSMDQRIRTVTTGCDSSGVSHKGKDILSGESARRGNAPSIGRSGGPWPVFLLWILWTWSEPMFTIRQIFPI